MILTYYSRPLKQKKLHITEDTNGIKFSFRLKMMGDWIGVNLVGGGFEEGCTGRRVLTGPVH
jgi:hypothetical protein